MNNFSGNDEANDDAKALLSTLFTAENVDKSEPLRTLLKAHSTPIEKSYTILSGFLVSTRLSP